MAGKTKKALKTPTKKPSASKGVKKPSKAEPKKKKVVKAKPAAKTVKAPKIQKRTSAENKAVGSKRLLTAEGWKRQMLLKKKTQKK